RIDISIMDEAQPRWLAFLGNDLDFVLVPPDFVPKALPNGKPPMELQKRGIVHHQFVAPSTYYAYFNLDDPLVGGYTPEKIALRRAIILGYRLDEDIAQVNFGQAVAARGPLSPGVAGYDPQFKTNAGYDPALAKALLDRYGYKDINGDGYRETPDGKPMVIQKGSTPTSQDQVTDEIWKRSMDAIGIKMEFTKAKWPDLVKSARLGKLPMWNVGWAAQIPDGDSYLQLLYGPNKNANNLSRFDLPAFNQRYEKARELPPGKERDQLYKEMAWLTAGYGVWHMGIHRIDNYLIQPWLLGFKEHPFSTHAFKFLDIDLTKKQPQGTQP
ncbi:MAG: bicyclomycin resistance protein, partial [Burkholderiales bacterium]|nr:bicyclomycin resistance protein [Burkholderiales bacterium]